GHPGFLKNACELLEKGKINLSKPEDRVARQLLQDHNIHNLCEDLWGDLDLDLQSTLRHRAAGILSSRLKPDAVQHLLRSGLFVRSQGGETVFFCQLFELYVQDYASAELTLLIAETNKVLRGVEEIDLTPLQFKLLSCLMEEPGRVYTREEIAQKVWGASMDDRVTPEMILRLIKRLRERINTPQHNYIQAHRGRGYEFVQGEK
ncbi:MAG: winged helix-turn-helix transcriptional regulator, partial [Candidatus Bathyarchaeota archaeon]